MLWLPLSILTGLAALCVAWPLLRRPRPRPPGEHDIAFYRAQIDAIARDEAAGLIAPADAAQARAEAGRRALAHTGEAAAPSRSGAAAATLALAALVFVPAASLGLYARIGHPDLSDLPFAARAQPAKDNLDIDALVARLEAHLAEHPEDGRGQELIAPVYLRLDRAGDAARAYAAALKLLGESAQRRAGLGEAMVAEAGGKVTAEARASFAMAAAADPAMAKAQFYLGVAAEQGGDKDGAVAIWSRMLEVAPPGAIWSDIVRARIAAATGRASPAQAIAALPQGEQAAVIRSMVEGLAARLAQDGSDVEGWLRLMRAFSVLKEEARAKAALADARKSLSSDAAALARINSMARELGLEDG